MAKKRYRLDASGRCWTVQFGFKVNFRGYPVIDQSGWSKPA